MTRADQLPDGATVWHPFGDDPGVLTDVEVTRADTEGMVALHAAELAEPLCLVADWPMYLTQ